MTDMLFLAPDIAQQMSQALEPVRARKVQAFQSSIELQMSAGDEPLQIVNLPSTLPEASEAKDRTALVKAGRLACNLPDDGLWAIARASTTPATLATVLRNDLATVVDTEVANLKVVSTHVLLSELFLLMQPRIGGDASTVRPPKITGLTDLDGAPFAVVRLEFLSISHLRGYLREQIVGTLIHGSDYSTSILARRVSQPITTHVAVLTFEDATPDLWVIAVRDGITRVVSSFRALLGGEPTADEIATYMVNSALARKPLRTGSSEGDVREFIRGREEIQRNRRSEFVAGTADVSHPTERAIRVGQTFSLPAQIYLAIDGDHRDLPAEQRFVDAADCVISSLHIEHKPWADEQGNAATMRRVLRRMEADGLVASKIVALALGEVGADQTSAAFEIDEIPNTALWRAVYLICWLCGPPAFEAMKGEMRSLLGVGQMRNRKFVAHLAPIVDIPWRGTKPRALRVARRAWAQNGPIPREVIGADWLPVPVAQFVDLVPIALGDDGDAQDARFTLMVAGGVALVADKMIASNTGSAVSVGTVPFRADPQTIVSGLGESEAGLWLLARAADAFDDQKQASNSFTSTELAAADTQKLIKTGGTYRIPALDSADPSKLAVDSAGAAHLLTEAAIVRQSDPKRAALAEKDAKGKGAPGPGVSKDQQARDLRSQIRSNLAAVGDALTKVLGMASDIGGHPLADPAYVDGIQTAVLAILTTISSNRPPEAPAKEDQFDDDAEPEQPYVTGSFTDDDSDDDQ